MEWMYGWGASICCAAVACAVLQFLAPDNSRGRILEMIGAAVLVCCMLSPLVTVEWDLTADTAPLLSSNAQNDMLQSQILQQLNEPLQTAVGEAATETLSSYGLKAEKFEAITDTDAQGGIYITKIVVTLTPDQAVRRLAVKQALQQRFQVDIEIVEEGV